MSGNSQLMGFYWFILGALCVWRITHLLQAEDGPWDLVVRLRLFAGATFWGKLLDCFYCLSLWVAVPFALGLGKDWKECAQLWPAFSAAACLLQQATASATAQYLEYPEESHDLLRRAEITSCPEQHTTSVS
jgi:hypothetical protein